MILEQNQQTREEILDQALRPEADGETNYTGARENRRDVEIQMRQEFEQPNENDHRLCRATENV